ncbi:MAG: MBL fold metallo-hydrolase, partial [Roseiflexaceae bacterium]
MDVRFLGGAGGVGASCVYVELAGRRVLIDAGVRMGGRDRLPDLAAIDGRDLAAIFVTHAHADHIGALPLVHQHVPQVPIYASPATIRLIEVMLADAVRVMARRAADELEFPLYDDALVASMLRVLRPLQLDEQSVAELPGITIHARRAGHVAGAVSLGFDAPDGRLVISGDVSMAAQRSILGAAIPAPKRPHLLVLESTYGARLHPNRRQEELRLAQAVAEWVQRGHVLIPAFALGRAQEVILILRAAQRDGLIPEFPIYVDGLVRTVCAAYASFPEALTPGLRNHILRGGRPFLGGTVRAVETPLQRERILEGPPCCIIASSGMLTGGPSAFYASRLVDRAEAAIVVTGYQDEEAPGRRLLDLAEGGGGEITIEGRALPLRCRVAKYALSAHADGGELAGLVRALQPKTVALVHGDPDARTALAAQLQGLA